MAGGGANGGMEAQHCHPSSIKVAESTRVAFTSVQASALRKLACRHMLGSMPAGKGGNVQVRGTRSWAAMPAARARTGAKRSCIFGEVGGGMERV